MIYLVYDNGKLLQHFTKRQDAIDSCMRSCAAATVVLSDDDNRAIIADEAKTFVVEEWSICDTSINLNDLRATTWVALDNDTEHEQAGIWSIVEMKSFLASRHPGVEIKAIAYFAQDENGATFRYRKPGIPETFPSPGWGEDNTMIYMTKVKFTDDTQRFHPILVSARAAEQLLLDETGHCCDVKEILHVCLVKGKPFYWAGGDDLSTFPSVGWRRVVLKPFTYITFASWETSVTLPGLVSKETALKEAQLQRPQITPTNVHYQMKGNGVALVWVGTGDPLPYPHSDWMWQTLVPSS